MTQPKHRRAHWTDHFNSPKAIARTGKSNPQLVAFTGAVGAAGAAEATKDKLPEEYQGKAETASHAVYGAAGGQAAYQLSGYGAKKANKVVNDPKIYKNPKTRRGGYTKPEYKKAIESNKKAHGIKDPNKKSDWKGFQRNYPKDVPGGKIVRVLSHTHGGNRGVAVGAAATAAGAALAVKAGKKKDEKVSKHASDPFEISKIKATTKLVAGAKRGLFDAAGVTHPKLREKAYAGNDPVKSKLYRFARTKTRTEMEPRLIALREHPAVKRAAFRIVREEAGKKVKAAKPYAAGAAVGGGAVGATAYAHKDEAEQAARKTTKKVTGSLHKRNLTQEQIDRRKKAQAVTSRTTGALGLGALGAQAVGVGVSRGKIRKLPTLKDGKVAMAPVKQTEKGRKQAADKIKSATVPALATSAGIGSIGAFNFASYTKAEAKQHEKKR